MGIEWLKIDLKVLFFPDLISMILQLYIVRGFVWFDWEWVCAMGVGIINSIENL